MRLTVLLLALLAAMPAQGRECDSVARPLTAEIEPCTPPGRRPATATPAPRLPPPPAGGAALRAYREGERYLQRCDGFTGDDARWCEVNHAQFLRAYVQAHEGRYHAQRNVAFMLRGSSPGVLANHVQSCAWRLLIFAKGHAEFDASDTANIRFDCGRLGAQDRAAAQARAVALVDLVRP